MGLWLSFDVQLNILSHSYKLIVPRKDTPPMIILTLSCSKSHDRSSGVVLRVVQTQAISFLKSLSERVWCDIIVQLLILNTTWIWRPVTEMKSRSMSDPPLSDIDLKKWLGSELPLRKLGLYLTLDDPCWISDSCPLVLDLV